MNDIFSLFNDPHARHAIFVHMPIVLCSLGIVPVLALALSGFKNNTLRWLCIIWFALAAGAAYLAVNSGDAAEESAEKAFALTDAAKHEIHEHEELAEGFWWLPIIPGALALISFAPKKPVRFTSGALAIIGAAACIGWISLTAHHGGKLVYQYGVGTPSPHLAAAAHAGTTAPAPNDSTDTPAGDNENDDHD